jgi:lipopolysaccharide export LptBFGC system permease protein LptF
MSNELYPWFMREIWSIEKNFKKKQEIGTLIRDFWFLKEDKDSRLYVYIGSLDIKSGNFSDLFLLKASKDMEVQKVIQCDLGIWKGNSIEVIFGTEYDFTSGSFKDNVSGDILEVEVSLEDVHLFAESVEHVSLVSLIHLYTLGDKIGFDTNPYVGEILYRLGISLFPIFLVIPVNYSMLRHRSLRSGILFLLLNTALVWFIVSLLDILPSKVGVSPLPVLLVYLLYFAYLLRYLYYLGKGFRL